MSEKKIPEIQKKRRRPHTRASKACAHCRQQKTRCLRSETSIACLRCVSLNLNCSLLQESELSKELPKLLSNPNNSFIQPQINNNQPKPINSFLQSKSSSPQLQSQVHPQLHQIYDFGNQMIPSINSAPVTNMLYDRSNIGNNQFNPKYLKQHENIQQVLSPNPMSPRLSQSFIPASPLPNNHDLELDNKLDIIHNDVKKILDSINSNSFNSNSSNLHSLINNDNLNYNSDPLPIMNEPVNTTNIAIQQHLLSPINCLKLLIDNENNINNDTTTTNNNSNNNKIESPLNLNSTIKSTNNNIINNSQIDSDISVSLPLCIQQQLYPLQTFKLNYEDIISSNILSINQAIELLDIFRDRYGRWVSFPAMTSTKKLLKRIRKRCPLLLTISCLLSLKYGDPLLKQKVWNKLYSILRKEVHWLTSTFSGCLEELQCLVILSSYCIGLSDSNYTDNSNSINNNNEPLLLLDGWYLSGIGLTLFEKINNYGLLDQMYGNEIELLWESNKIKTRNRLESTNCNNITKSNSNNNNNNDDEIDEDYDDDDLDEFNLLTLHRIWNTLVLVQLAYCLLDGRKSWIGLEKLKPRDVSNLATATNFDFRIVAEIHMYLIGYKYILLNENYELTIKSIKIWLEKWNSTFSQPSNQFVEIDYHFIEILIKIKQLKLDLSSLEILSNDSLKDIQDIKMHSIAIINLINTVNDDSYFAFLSDQIHLTVFYAANILICILSLLNKFYYQNSNNMVNDDSNNNEMDNNNDIKNLGSNNINNNDNNNNDNDNQINDMKHNKEIINKIERLIFRYRTVAATKSDTFYKYFNTLYHIYNTKLKKHSLDS